MLTKGEKIKPILQTISSGTRKINLEDLITRGDNGILCAECGGPSPGVGCAGRGIISAFEILDKLSAFEIYKPDFVLYDVLGDVVCGGFAMPLRKGYAKEVYIVTSGELMSMYAAQNIASAVAQFSSKGYARLCGIIQNSRNVANEDTLIEELAEEIGVRIATRIPRDPEVQSCESHCSTVASIIQDGEYLTAIERLADYIEAR